MLIQCMKCKKKTETIDPKEVVMKNGKHAITGQCAICGTKKYVFVKK